MKKKPIKYDYKWSTGKDKNYGVVNTENVNTAATTNDEGAGYDKMTFNDAFRKARAAGLKTFPWKGELKTTELASKGASDRYFEQKKFLTDDFAVNLLPKLEYGKMSEIDSSDANWEAQKKARIEIAKLWEQQDSALAKDDFPTYDKLEKEADSYRDLSDSHPKLDSLYADELSKANPVNQFLGRLKKPAQYFSITQQKGAEESDGYMVRGNDPDKKGISKLFIHDSPSANISVHENTHRGYETRRLNELTPYADQKQLRENAQGEYFSDFADYVSSPIELAARHNSTRYYLSKHFPNYKTSDNFKQEHLDFLRSKSGTLPFDVQQLFSTYGSDYKSWNTQFNRYAKGGPIKKFAPGSLTKDVPERLTKEKPKEGSMEAFKQHISDKIKYDQEQSKQAVVDRLQAAAERGSGRLEESASPIDLVGTGLTRAAIRGTVKIADKGISKVASKISPYSIELDNVGSLGYRTLGYAPKTAEEIAIRNGVIERAIGNRYGLKGKTHTPEIEHNPERILGNKDFLKKEPIIDPNAIKNMELRKYDLDNLSDEAQSIIRNPDNQGKYIPNQVRGNLNTFSKNANGGKIPMKGYAKGSVTAPTPDEGNPQKEWIKHWMRDPEYKKRLMANWGDKPLESMSKGKAIRVGKRYDETIERFAGQIDDLNIREAKYPEHNAQVISDYIDAGEGENYFYGPNGLKKPGYWPEQMRRTDMFNDMYQNNAGQTTPASISNTGQAEIIINNRPEMGAVKDSPGVKVHEMIHATDLDQYLMPAFDKVPHQKFEREDRYNQLKEVYPEIMQYRYDNKIKPGQIIDAEFLRSHPIKTNGLPKYSEEDLIKIFNTTASTNEQDGTQRAARGGKIKRFAPGSFTEPVKETAEVKTSTPFQMPKLITNVQQRNDWNNFSRSLRPDPTFGQDATWNHFEGRANQSYGQNKLNEFVKANPNSSIRTPADVANVQTDLNTIHDNYRYFGFPTAPGRSLAVDSVAGTETSKTMFPSIKYVINNAAGNVIAQQDFGKNYESATGTIFSKHAEENKRLAEQNLIKQAEQQKQQQQQKKIYLNKENNDADNFSFAEGGSIDDQDFSGLGLVEAKKIKAKPANFGSLSTGQFEDGGEVPGGCQTGSCKSIPAYGGRAKMIRKQDEIGSFKMKAKNNPYYVKPKKIRSVTINRNFAEGGDIKQLLKDNDIDPNIVRKGIRYKGTDKKEYKTHFAPKIAVKRGKLIPLDDYIKQQTTQKAEAAKVVAPVTQTSVTPAPVTQTTTTTPAVNPLFNQLNNNQNSPTWQPKKQTKKPAIGKTSSTSTVSLKQTTQPTTQGNPAQQLPTKVQTQTPAPQENVKPASRPFEFYPPTGKEPKFKFKGPADNVPEFPLFKAISDWWKRSKTPEAKMKPLKPLPKKQEKIVMPKSAVTGKSDVMEDPNKKWDKYARK